MDYDDWVQRNNVIGIRKADFYGSFSLQFLGNSSEKGISYTERTIDGSGGGIWDESKKPKVEDFQGKTIEQQLLEAGFIKDDFSYVDNSYDSKEVFRIQVEEDGKTYEIVATTTNGQLEKLLKPIDDRVSKHITPKTKILSYTIGSNESSLITL